MNLVCIWWSLDSVSLLCFDLCYPVQESQSDANSYIIKCLQRQVTSVNELTGQICQICGDEIEFGVDGETFVACNECAFPVCRPCYEYERREGNQACPQCKTRYKRIKGSPRVDGDEEEEEEFDDLENEFDYNSNDRRDPHQIGWRLNSGVLCFGNSVASTRFCCKMSLTYRQRNVTRQRNVINALLHNLSSSILPLT